MKDEEQGLARVTYSELLMLRKSEVEMRERWHTFNHLRAQEEEVIMFRRQTLMHMQL